MDIRALLLVVEVCARLPLAPRFASSDVSERSTPRKIALLFDVLESLLRGTEASRPLSTDGGRTPPLATPAQSVRNRRQY